MIIMGLLDDVFVPFLGDFLSIGRGASHVFTVTDSFRPLSWGLSFNFSAILTGFSAVKWAFSSPFLGTFFQLPSNLTVSPRLSMVFVPFLGDFLSITWTITYYPLD